MNVFCECRFCQKRYNYLKATADYKGYCSMKCQHAKARKLGYRKGKNHETSSGHFLFNKNQVGNIYAKEFTEMI